MTKQELFNQWIALKEDIQQLAAIVQNDIEISEEDLCLWLQSTDRFKTNFNTLKSHTIRMIKMKDENDRSS